MKSLKLFAAILLAGICAACTDRFEEMDFPKTASTVIDPGPILTRSFVTGSGMSVGIWQYTNQLTTLDWVQYVSTIKADFTTAHYETVPRTDVWSWWYSQESFAGLHLSWHAIRLAEAVGNPVTEAVARIWRVYMFQYMTDMYGDIPYSEAFEESSPVFDTQEFIYNDMIAELQNSVMSLEENRDKGYPSLGTADIFFGGDAGKWIKFGNSMLIRLAMQCSNVDSEEITRPVLASLSLSDPSVYISGNEDNVRIIPDAAGPTYHVKNPYQYVASWDEMRISENLYNRLYANDDPRMEIYMAPNEAGEYVGLPSGQPIEDLNADYESKYVPDYCDIGEYFIRDETPFVLVSASEIAFLLAEAALKGYIQGDAGEWYRKAVTLSMEYYGIEGNEISSFLDRVPYSEDNLYTQFWIALFPNGPQSWNLVRRTGRPEISPLAYHWPDNGEMPRRFSYSTDEIRYNPDNTRAAISRMGGDSQYTRMWWDKQK